MNIELIDTLGFDSFGLVAPPAQISTIEGATDIVTLDNNLSTYFTENKREWSNSWSYMSEAEYSTLKGYYDRQWTTFQFPLLTIDQLNVSNQVVRMYLNTQSVINNCGLVEGVEVRFRETVQN